MTLTEKVIRDCIARKITDKHAMADYYCTQLPTITHEQARDRIRRMLGSHGRDVALKNAQLYNDYMNACAKSSHYEQAQKKELRKSKTYIVTSALNNTPVHMSFWNNILKYAEFKGAEIHVVAMRYKNVTSIFSDKNEDVWTKEVLPYLDANNHQLFDDIQLLSKVKISPTAALPLSGMNGFTGDKSSIVGHTRSHFICVPVVPGNKPKIMMTTGSCTLANYTDSKAGRVGEHHHVYGFVIATEGDMHQVTAQSDGSFIDYEWQVKDGIVTKSEPALALILGDMHYAKMNKCDEERIIDRIRMTKSPKVIIHDCFDAESVNPHVEKCALQKVMRYNNGKHSLADELDKTLDFLKRLKTYCDELVLVASNHDDMLTRYLSSMQWQYDHINALKYAELLPIALREENGVFPYLASQIGVKCLTLNDSYKVADIELAFHGHNGSGGSRGSLMQFKNLSSKLVVGHSHSPARIDGCDCVGVQNVHHDYAKGLSNWMVADVVINANGKRQVIFGNYERN